MSVLGLRWCGLCSRGVSRRLGPCSGGVGWCYVCVVVSPDSLCTWHVQVFVYCSRLIPGHLSVPNVKLVAPYRYLLPTMYFL